MPMLASVTTYEDCLAEDGTDCRNYGVLDGIPEAKRLMASMLDDDAEHVIVFGSSKLEHHVRHHGTLLVRSARWATRRGASLMR